MTTIVLDQLIAGFAHQSGFTPPSVYFLAANPAGEPGFPPAIFEGSSARLIVIWTEIAPSTPKSIVICVYDAALPRRLPYQRRPRAKKQTRRARLPRY
jgi:hypothetical protein